MAIPTKPAFLPNMKKVATPVAAVVEEPVVEETTETTEEDVQMEEVATEEAAATEEVVVEKKKRQKRQADGERKTPNRQMTNEDISFIVSNVKTMSYTEMADARGVTKSQVNRVLMEVKKNLRDQAKDDPKKLAAVEEYIKDKLSRPEDSLPGSRSSAVKDSIDDIVNGILGVIK
jgi:hypothetical protein